MTTRPEPGDLPDVDHRLEPRLTPVSGQPAYAPPPEPVAEYPEYADEDYAMPGDGMPMPAEDDVETSYKNGVLTVTIAKPESPETTAKQIPIKGKWV